MSATIRVERAGAVTTIVIDNPAKRNSFTPQMLDLLTAAATALAVDAEVGAVILRGAGDLAFSAGADFDAFETASAEAFARWFRTMEEALDRAVASLLALPQPLIAALAGPCMGGAVQLALCADLRLASDQVRLAIPAASTGIVYPLDAIERLVHLCGTGGTSLLLLAGATFAAEQANQAGMIDMVVAHAAFEEQLAAVAAKLARQPKDAIRAYKQIINGIARGSDRAALRAIQQSVNGSDETARLVAATISKRSARRQAASAPEVRTNDPAAPG
jgi:enoyl-CoA hydratase/carnithine racemase